MGRLAIALLVITGCTKSTATECAGGRVCPSELVCDEVHTLCVTEEQTTACAALADGDRCTADAGPGICDRGVCIPGCGNGAVENLTYLDLVEECDDGNPGSHDGCSSTCTAEVLVWSPWEDAWTARLGHAAAYDSDRQRIVVFGGSLTGGFTNELWERDDARVWTHVPVQGAWPSARIDAAMAYDSTRDVIVLFGGFDVLGNRLADTWEYDGTAWVQRQPAAPPLARRGATMVFDPIDNKMVLFGGDAGGRNLADTWEYDGTTWTLTTSFGPDARKFGHMTWDNTRQQVVLFGGLGDNYLDDTWSYTANAWTVVVSATAPRARYSGHMAFSSDRGTTVLYSGVTPAGFVSDQWELGAGGWSQIPLDPITPTLPSARVLGALVDDPGTGSLVLIAGRDASALEDVWELASGTWTVQLPQLSPIPRETGRMIEVPSIGSTLVVGGLNGAPLGDVWTFDGTRWTREQAFPGVAVYGHALGYDPVRDRVVMYGGIATGSALQGTTHEWNPATRTWQTHAAPVRDAHRLGAIAFDPTRGALVLFGGAVGATVVSSTATDETWEYNGTWTQSVTTTRPPAMGSPSMAYDPVGGRLVLYTQNETWQRIGSEWSKIETAAPGELRSGSMMVFHPDRQRIWLYGGSSGNTIYSDVWELDDDVWTQLQFAGSGPEPRRLTSLAPLAGHGLVLHAGTSADAVLGDTWILRYR